MAWKKCVALNIVHVLCAVLLKSASFFFSFSFKKKVFCVLGSWLIEFSGVADFVKSCFVLFLADCSHGLNITNQTRRLAPISLVTVILYSESVVRKGVNE